ncbi:MAG: polyhydroxyalkanoate synthesis regulator DNA-binding domain-containing protein [Deltaproteobacteria bacterium]
MATEQILIKKYSNRRLYCVDRKKFVTLEEIAAFITDGGEVKILDAETDEDITKPILIQIILESEENKTMEYPLSKVFLHVLIKQGYRMAVEFVENYLVIVFQPYLVFSEKMRKNLLSFDKGISSIMKSQMSPKFIDPFEFRRNQPSQGQDKREPPLQASTLTMLMELEFLRARVAELESQISPAHGPMDESDPPAKPRHSAKSKTATL